MSNISNQIANQIKKEKIKPKSKWIFLLRNYLVWSFFIGSIIIGGLASVMILFIFTNSDLDIYKHLDKGFTEYLLLSIPYFWIGLLILFIFLAHYNYRHTSKGYRHRAYGIIFVNIFLSIIIGITFFHAGMGNKIEKIFTNNFPYYNNLAQHRKNKEKMWNQPERGLIAGKIINIEKNYITLKDLSDKSWQIDTTNTLWKGNMTYTEGVQIKVVGTKEEDSIFNAVEIRPWTHPKHFFKKNR